MTRGLCLVAVVVVIACKDREAKPTQPPAPPKPSDRSSPPPIPQPPPPVVEVPIWPLAKTKPGAPISVTEAKARATTAEDHYVVLGDITKMNGHTITLDNELPFFAEAFGRSFAEGRRCRVPLVNQPLRPVVGVVSAKPAASADTEVDDVLGKLPIGEQTTVVGVARFTYRCPSCPPGADCKPCPGERIRLDGSTQEFQVGSARIEEGQRYRLTLTVRSRAFQLRADGACWSRDADPACARLDAAQSYRFGARTSDSALTLMSIGKSARMCTGFPLGASLVAMRPSDARIVYLHPDGWLREYLPGAEDDLVIEARCPDDKLITRVYFDRTTSALTLGCRETRAPSPIFGANERLVRDGNDLGTPKSFLAISQPIGDRFFGIDCSPDCVFAIFDAKTRALTKTKIEVRNSARTNAIASANGWFAVADFNDKNVTVYKIDREARANEHATSKLPEGKALGLLETGAILALEAHPDMDTQEIVRRGDPGGRRPDQ